MPERKEPPHPMQPVIIADDGYIRFKQNKIIDYLFKAGKLDLNELAFMDFSDEDRMQLAQLLGYSISGYSELSYVSDKSYDKAERKAKILRELLP